MATICASLVMGFNMSFIMELSEVPFIVGVALLAGVLLLIEILRRLFPERKYWSIFNCLLLAFLLGICAGEICHATVFKVVLLDTIIIALITAGVSIYQNVMERKDDLEYQERAGQKVAAKRRKDVEKVPKVTRKKAATAENAPKAIPEKQVGAKEIPEELREIHEVVDETLEKAKKSEENDEASDTQGTENLQEYDEMPSPKVIANLMQIGRAHV